MAIINRLVFNGTAFEVDYSKDAAGYVEIESVTLPCGACDLTEFVLANNSLVGEFEDAIEKWEKSQVRGEDRYIERILEAA